MDRHQHAAGLVDLPGVVDGEKITLHYRKDSDEEPPARQKQPRPERPPRAVVELDQQAAIRRRDGSGHRYLLGVEPRHNVRGVFELREAAWQRRPLHDEGPASRLNPRHHVRAADHETVKAHHIELPVPPEHISYTLGGGGTVAETEATGQLLAGLCRLPQHVDGRQVVHGRESTTASGCRDLFISLAPALRHRPDAPARVPPAPPRPGPSDG